MEKSHNIGSAENPILLEDYFEIPQEKGT